MYIVIAGGGVFGQALAARLVANHHDVVVIERDKAVCELLSAKVGALAIQGTATNIDVLEDSGIERAEVESARRAKEHADRRTSFAGLEEKAKGVARHFEHQFIMDLQDHFCLKSLAPQFPLHL